MSLVVIAEVNHKDSIIREFESGTIEVLVKNKVVTPAKPQLRKIASELGIPILSDSGNTLNTRQLGNHLIKFLERDQPSKQ